MMMKKAAVAALWLASLVAVAYWRDVESTVSAQPGSIPFDVQRVTSSNGFTLVKTTAGASSQVRCFLLSESQGDVALAPLDCPR